MQGRIHRADHALDESSGQMRRAAARLEAAQARYQQARAELQAVQARLGAAAVRDRAMQVRLQAAVERLAEARHELDAGQAAVDAQRRQVTDTITSIYEGGAPELIALSSLLDAQSPEDLTRQAEARDIVVGRETRAYDDLHAAEVLLQVRETEVEAARDDVAVQRRAAAAHLVTMRELTAQTRAAKQKVQEYVATRRAALRRGRAGAPPGPGGAGPAAAARGQHPRPDPGRGPPRGPQQRRLPRPQRRAAVDARRRPGHLAVRLPDPPDLPLLRPARRHRLRRRLRPAAARGRRRHA